MPERLPPEGSRVSLSPLDGAFLSLESPKDHLNIGLVGVFDPGTSGGGWSYQRVRGLLEARLDRMPLLRQRLVHVPFDLNQPLWADDERFDLDAHLHRAALPAPGSVRELADLAATVISRPFDFERPLWELWTVEGLEGGRVAHVLKSHHAALDGIAIAELGLHLTDPQPEPDGDEAPAPWRAAPGPSLARRCVHAARGVSQEPVSAVRLATSAARRLGQKVRGEQGTAPPLLTAPRTPFNGHVSSRRTAAFTSMPLGDVRAVGQATGATTNDVVLAVCAGALRARLAQEDALPERPLLALVPRSVRRDEDPQGRGNRLVPMLVPIPTHLDDPTARLEAAAAGATAAKQRAAEGGEAAFAHLPELAPPALTTRVTRFYADHRLADHHPPLFNLTISNVPGPTVPLYSAAARMQGVYPMGPVYEGSGLNITVTSYLDTLQVGIVACPDRVPDPWALGHELAESLAELLKHTT